MRVLYFSRDYTPHDHRFLAALARSGYQVHYLRLERSETQLEDRPLPSGVTAVLWSGGQRPARLWDGPRLARDLRRVIRTVKPDLIHAGPIQSSGLLAALTGFHPLVLVSWGSDLLRDADKNALWRRITRYTLSRGDALVGDCDTVRQKAISLGFPADRIVAFPWGVDLAHFSPDGREDELSRTQGRHAPGDQRRSLRERLGWQDGFILLSTRGWEPIYGVDLLARAFTHAAQRNPDLRLILLGGGSQAALLRRIFLQGDILDRVHIGGQVKQQELPQYFRAADLYVSASRSDGTSISLLEALACGTPALVSDIPGNREWITPGEHGWLFPDGDVPALAQAILHAAAAGETLASMGRAARALATQRADWKLNFDKLLQAYEIAVAAAR